MPVVSPPSNAWAGIRNYAQKITSGQAAVGTVDVVFDLPAGCLKGDFVVIVLLPATGGTLNSVLGTSTTYTTVPGASSQIVYAFLGADNTTFTANITSASAGLFTAIIYVFRGATAIDATPVYNGSAGGDPNASAITTVNTVATVLVVAMSIEVAPGGVVTSSPTGYTQYGVTTEVIISNVYYVVSLHRKDLVAAGVEDPAAVDYTPTGAAGATATFSIKR